MFFADRREAGEKLAEKMMATGRDFGGYKVVGIARGGVIVAHPVARVLGLPIRTICIDETKMGRHTYYATSVGMSGAVASLQDDLNRSFRLEDEFDESYPKCVASLMAELRLRHETYQGGYAPDYGDKVILVDDGLVSGDSVIVAAHALRCHGVKSIIVAIPVVPPWVPGFDFGFEVETWRVSKMKNTATGMYYRSFPDTEDDEVIAALA